MNQPQTSIEEDQFAGFELVTPSPSKTPVPAQQPQTTRDEFAGFDEAKTADRPIMSPYLRGVAEGKIKDELPQHEGRKAAPWLGYAPEQALATATQVADFPAGLVRGAKGAARSLWQFAIGEENTEKLEQMSYKIPMIGQILEYGDKYLEASGKVKNEAMELLRREAIERGGLPGAVAAELVGTIQNTLMYLKSVKTLGVGYGGQAGVSTTLKSAAVRATFSALTSEGLSPKDRLAAFGWGLAYQSTPALSSTIGKWGKSDMLAKVSDVFANAGITGVQVPRMIEQAYTRAEAEGKPEMGGFYFTLEAVKAFGSDVVFGVMTKAFRDAGQPQAAKSVERLEGNASKLAEDIQRADAELADFMAKSEQDRVERKPEPVLSKAEQDEAQRELMDEQALLRPAAEKVEKVEPSPTPADPVKEPSEIRINPDGTVDMPTGEHRAPKGTWMDKDGKRITDYTRRKTLDDQVDAAAKPAAPAAKPIQPPPAPTQKIEQAATPLSTEGAAGVKLDISTDERLLSSLGIPFREANIPLNDLKLSPDVPQFKEDIVDTKTGETEPLGGKFDKLGVAPIVVWERQNGEMEVVTGRHRRALAMRSGEKAIKAHVLREADGFDRGMATMIDAVSNIRDGQGKVSDYANFFRNSPETTLDQASIGGLLARNKGRAGWVLGKNASEDLYALYRAGKIGEQKAVAIAEGLPNQPERQASAVTYASSHNVEQTRGFVQAINAIPVKRGKQLDLLGWDEADKKRMDDMAQASTEIISKKKSELSALRSALALGASKKKGEILKQFGFKSGDTDKIEDRVDVLAHELERWEVWGTDKELSDIVARAAGYEPERAATTEPTTGKTAPQEIPGTGDIFNLSREDARAKMAEAETAKKDRELAEAKAKMDSQVDDMFGEKPSAPTPAEPAFNALMDSLKKTSDTAGARLSEGEIRTALESMPETGNKARFKDMDATQQQAAMDAMQRMVDERSPGPGAAMADDPDFQPRMSIKKDGIRMEPEGGVTGLRNAQIERERSAYGLKPGLDKIRVSDPQAWNEAMVKLEANPNAGQELVNELVQNERPTTKWENALLLRQLVEVNLEHNRAATATLKAAESGDPNEIRDASLRHEKATQAHETIADVLDRTGTLTAQALQSRKMFADEEYNLATMEIQLRAAAGKRQLSADERAKLQKISEEYQKTIDALETKVAELERQAKEKADADAAMDEIREQAQAKSKRERADGKEPDLDADRDRTIKNMRNKSESGAVETVADLQNDIQKLALYFEQKDIDTNRKSTLTHEKLIEQVHGVVKTLLPDATPDEVRDAISGYGQVRYPSEDAAKVALRRHKSEMLKVAPLETVQANIAKLKADGAAAAKELTDTKRTGYQREPIEARAREINKQLQTAMKEQDRLMKELGIETGDPAKRLKTSLDAKKTRLRNQIDDIDRAITNHKELAKNKGLPVDDDTTRALTIQRDERMALYKEMFPDKPMTPEQRLEHAIKAAEKRLLEWEDRAALARQGVFQPKDKTEALPRSERLSLLNAEAEALKAEVRSWHELAFPKATPEERRLQAWKSRTEKSITETERRIKEKDFSKRPKPEPIILDKEGFELKKANDAVKDEWQGMIRKEQMKNRTWTQKLWDRTTEPFNVARSYMASHDFSGTLRQGFVLVVTRPTTAVKSLPDQFRAFASEHEAYKTNQKIMDHPLYVKFIQAGGELTKIGGRLIHMEESFMSRLSGRIPIVARSERAYVTFLNKLRFDTFVALHKTMAKTGEPTAAEYKVLAEYVNMATGRAPMGRAAVLSRHLATVFWAPRLFVSRFQLLAGAPMYHGTARTRKLMAGEYARFLGGITLMYMLADTTGAEIESDPRSGSFGKLRFGNTRVDPMAGLAQATTLAVRVAKGETKTQSGEIRALRGEDKPPFGRGTGDVMGAFLRSKFSPLLGSAWDLATGETIIGEPTTPTDIIKRSVVPLSWRHVYDSMVEQGIPGGAALTVLSIFGMGVQTYDDQREQSSKKQRITRERIRLYNERRESRNQPEQ